MLKQSPSRGHKSKGLKVKHILQICVLVAVCVWLVYQVKHSQDKRREFDADGEKIVDKEQIDSDILRFGRKDLPRGTEIATGGNKHVEDDEEKEFDEEDNKPEEEENKHGEDETDENELEKKEAEHEHGEEQVEDGDKEDDDEDVEENHTENEEKLLPGKEEHYEAEENEEARNDEHSSLEEIQDVDAEDHTEKDAASNDQDRDVENVDTREARDENYKADDASSEVAHHVHNIIPETKNATLGQANDIFGKVDVGQESETKNSGQSDTLGKAEVEPRENSDGISNGTVIDQNKYQNSTTNSTSVDGEHPGFSNGLQMTFNGNVSQNATVEGESGDIDSNLLGNVLGTNDKPKLSSDENNQFEASGNKNKTDDALTNIENSLSSRNITMFSPIANNTEAAKDISVSNKSPDEKLVSNGVGGSHESSNSLSKDEGAGAIQHDPIDESDTNITEEDRESKVDLDTLPHKETEGQNAEEAMAE